MSRLPTGISILDRRLGGGLPAGSVVAFCAEPASQSELFLSELAAERGTLYLTSVRSETAVRDGFKRTGAQAPTIRELESATALDQANGLVSTLPDGANLILDSVDPLERSEPSRYRRFLNELQTHMVNTGGIAYLHGLKGEAVANNRDVTKQVADVVFDLQTEVTPTEVVNRLAVPKFRGGGSLDEPMKLNLETSVRIDTSRDIA